MKSLRDPRVLIASILLLLALAFLGGTLKLIHTAQAASASASLPAGHRDARFAGKPEGIYREMDLTPTVISTEASSSTPTPEPVSADTTGIIALAIVIVATILLGAGIGVRGYSPRKKPAK